jgi:hypothetical protein
MEAAIHDLRFSRFVAEGIQDSLEVALMSRRRTFGTFSFLLGAAVGAGLMALVDPDRGASRRAQIRQKALHRVKAAGHEGQKQVRRFGGYLWGGIAETKARFRDRRRKIPDDRLYDRVRAQLGHAVYYLNLLEIAVVDGEVRVRGPVLAGERERISHRLNETRGIRNFTIDVEELSAPELRRRVG